MCFHLTATLPKGTNLQQLRNIIDRYDMDFQPINNPYVAPQLHLGEQYFIATKGHCDCGTVLGFSSRSKEFEALVQSKKARSLRKKGWSDEQIEHWAREKLKNTKKSHGRKFSPVEIHQETTRWINFLRDIIQQGNLARVGLIKHWYKGRLDTEQFTIKQSQKIHMNAVTSEFLTKLEEDTLYEFNK